MHTCKCNYSLLYMCFWYFLENYFWSGLSPCDLFSVYLVLSIYSNKTPSPCQRWGQGTEDSQAGRMASMFSSTFLIKLIRKIVQFWSFYIKNMNMDDCCTCWAFNNQTESPIFIMYLSISISVSISISIESNTHTHTHIYLITAE